MRTAIRWGASLVIAAASAAALADEGALARNTRGIEYQTVMMERYPDADAAVNHRRGGGAAARKASRTDEPRGDVVFVRKATGERVDARAASAARTDPKDAKESSDERWLREREGYRDGGY